MLLLCGSLTAATLAGPSKARLLWHACRARRVGSDTLRLRFTCWPQYVLAAAADEQTRQGLITMAARHYTDILQTAEETARPAVIRGLNAGWPALARWSGLEGLSYLKSAAGQATVQAMVAPSSNFFGDIEQHTSVACTLGQLLDIAAQQHQQQRQPLQDSSHQAVASTHAAADDGSKGSLEGLARLNLYLAQQSLQDPGLSHLLNDVPVPEVLHGKQLTSINMWFSSRRSRSSTHYDPYQNLLCVITGSKRLRLFSPAAGLGLYPRALGGEASNHSSVNFAEPDLDKHPLYKHVRSQALDVVLYPGDALFIPEGWWHQVDSDDMTFAVNFWWSSSVADQIRAVPHQHHYYLRQLLAATSNEAVELMVAGIQPWKWSPPPPPPAIEAAAVPPAAVAQSRKRRRVEVDVEPQDISHKSSVTCKLAAAVAVVGTQYLAASVGMSQAANASAAVGMNLNAAGDIRDEPSQRAAVQLCGGSGSESDSSSSSSGETHSSSSNSSSGTAGSDDDSGTPSSSDDTEVDQADPVAARDPDNNLVRVELTAYEQAALQEMIHAVGCNVGPSSKTVAADAPAHCDASVEAPTDVTQQQQQQQQQWGLTVHDHVDGADTLAPQQVVQTLQQTQAAYQTPGMNDKQGHNATAAAANAAATVAAAGHDAAATVTDGVLTSGRWWRQQEKAQQQLLLTAVGRMPAYSAAEDPASAAAYNAGGSASNVGKVPDVSSTAKVSDGSTLLKVSCNSNPAAAGQDSLGLASRFAQLLAALSPFQLLRILWVAAGSAEAGGCGDAVRRLLLHGLTPAVAYMLPQRFEAADISFQHDYGDVKKLHTAKRSFSSADGSRVQDTAVQQPAGEAVAVLAVPFTREEFYERIYATVSDPDAVLHNLVRGKARLAVAAADFITRCHMGVCTCRKQYR